MLSLIKPYLFYISMHGLGISLLLGYGLGKLARGRAWRWTDGALQILATIAYVAMSGVAVAYLFYPNFIDHVEPTVASLGLIFRSGGDIYPPVDTYTFHGLLYGPLLAMVQALFQGLSDDPIFNAKLPGVLAFVGFFALSWYWIRPAMARGYLLIVLTFGLFVFWNRPEPFFLLLVALAAGLRASQHSRVAWLGLGLLTALAFGLKAHAILYILPWVYWRWHDTRDDVMPAATLWSLGAAVGCVFCFAWPQVSVAHYLEYMRLASQHGISLRMLERNLVLVALMAVPLLLHWNPWANAHRGVLAVALVCELLVAVVGAKPGAGTHHLLPFLFLNALVLSQMLQAPDARSREWVKYAMLLLALYLLLADLPRSVRSEAADNRFSIQPAIRQELTLIAREYPDALMGVSNGVAEPYARTFYRVLLISTGQPQLDAAAFMDLNFSGTGDRALADALRSCRRPVVVLPKDGAPFSIPNFYPTKTTLFSDEVRQTFQQSYHLVASKTFYDVYTCQTP